MTALLDLLSKNKDYILQCWLEIEISRSDVEEEKFSYLVEQVNFKSELKLLLIEVYDNLGRQKAMNSESSTTAQMGNIARFLIKNGFSESCIIIYIFRLRGLIIKVLLDELKNRPMLNIGDFQSIDKFFRNFNIRSIPEYSSPKKDCY